MTLDQLKQLDAPLLTRAIAEVVCKFVHVRKNVFKEEKRFAENFLTFDFDPLTSIDDAVLCVDKLFGVNRCFYPSNLKQVMNSIEDYNEFNYVNASAELRILALLNTMPEIMVKYNQLKGER